MSGRHRREQFGEIDRWASECGHALVAGVDEAGRGAMAGPLVAAAVILPAGCELEAVDDSKRLTPLQRERAYDEITDAAIAWAVGVVEPEMIDRLNVLGTTHLAMRQALESLDPPAEFALIDGYEPSGIALPHRAVIGGDGLSLSIAAASVVAKVVRDRIMARLDCVWPGYDLARHKGYCTEAHRDALERLGPSLIHRKRFALVARHYDEHLPLDRARKVNR
jgi:ribonuclease HII